MSAARCDHAYRHSGRSAYSRRSRRLRGMLVCERCGTERNEVYSVSYEPRFRRYANNPAELTARALGLPERIAEDVRLAALLCDIGKAQIPAAILAKPGPLTDEEWIELRRYPELGASALNGDFQDMRAWIAAHRERFDGGGYPCGLAGEQIPLEARVLAVSSAYEAMISKRPYRDPLSDAQARAELRRGAGTQFDARVVAAFLGVLD